MVGIVGVDKLLVLLKCSNLVPHFTGSYTGLGKLVVTGYFLDRTIADIVTELPKTSEDLNGMSETTR
jgi:hypothetical protein